MQDPSSLQHPSTKPPKKGATGRGGEGSVREENKGGDGRKKQEGPLGKSQKMWFGKEDLIPMAIRGLCWLHQATGPTHSRGSTEKNNCLVPCTKMIEDLGGQTKMIDSWFSNAGATSGPEARGRLRGSM